MKPESQGRVLVVEDDRSLARAVAAGLRESGFEVHHAGDAAAVEKVLAHSAPSAVLLDLGLPDADGLVVLGRIRALWPSVPILITTARDGISDRVKGLEAGADDYLTKPFALEELLARIRALLRRAGRNSPVLSVGTLSIDITHRQARRDAMVLDLTPREFDVLYYLASHPGELISKETLQREVWQVRNRMTSMDNIIEVHISRLRQKLESIGESGVLRTVRGVGYTLKADT